ncbi:bifunctional hydroxymethylpyrimidine kinase/phosphomethylpyrimidine kinase [Sphingobacterium sp. SGR-19]|uniref:bifunctional hydroxymethylpyrimidine kinase/phosphomethylpyrimidine kinase n=1 Tax=Sphingobacterium sp. SGR-19 TaxID=2710886 RepID=UPI0013EC2037|nr:bifunctional hydroxymethylpyrimidine kinase/phosphomethylpyrimidine kinase [Sphingobacterium sp. SGR-19]NGM65123.1 bifunctional hydroxymethylpyrimidine kinase/phosphomethylpyrimidine kinase [Sphingobacterium sp. SGR-19]
MKKYKYPSVLTIAGFDGSGGAGIQADIKTISALGCYATSVLTALPVQNTQGVKNIFPIPIEAVAEQLDAIMEDIVPDAIKIGMVHTPQLVDTIVTVLQKYPDIPVVFDPVMVATSGHPLIEERTIDTIIEKLLPLSTVITPNMDEAAIMAKIKVETVKEMELAGKSMKQLGSNNILLKGGHQKTEMITSLLLDEENNCHSFEFNKIETNNTHGSGCTLSSAIASYMAQGKELFEAVTLGQQYVFNAIQSGADTQTGKGNGPLNHFFNPQKLIKNEMV